MFDLIREIAQTLRNNKLRTALTGLAVAWGVFMLIVLLGVSRATVGEAMSNFDMESASNIEVYGGRTTKSYKGYREGRIITLNTDDEQNLTHSRNANIGKAIAVIAVDTAALSTSTQTFGRSGMRGIMPGQEERNRIEIIAGRALNEPDMLNQRRVMLICKRAAEVLFGDAEKAVGKQVTSMGLSWKVVGVYDHRWRDESYAPYTTVFALRGFKRDLNQITVNMRDVHDMDDAKRVEKDVRTTVARTHDFDTEDESAVWTWNQFESYLMQQTVGLAMNSVVWVIGLLTLLSGIVGVSNIMFVSVRERTHEIGIRRAIGAKPRSILVQVLAESVAITTLFGYIGIVLGIVVTELIRAIATSMGYPLNPTVDLGIAVQVTVVLIIVGALAGIFPARKATKVSPVEALRDE